MNEARGRVRSILTAVILGVLGSLLVIIAAEFGLRLYRYGSLSMEPVLFVRDPDLLYKLNPEHPDFPDSIRGGGPDPNARINVVCMGGSTTFGHEVAVDQTWPAVAERVTRRQGIDARFVNAGVPGYGSRQLLVRYRKYIRRWQTEMVIVYSGWNRTGALVGSSGWIPGAVISERSPSLGKRLYSLGGQSILLRGLYRVFVLSGETKVWQPDDTYDLYVEDIRQIVREVLSDGRTPVLIVYPSLFHSDMSAEELSRYCEIIRWEHYDPRMIEDIERKHASIRSIGAEEGAVVIDVHGEMDGIRGQERVELFMDTGHPTVKGYELVGRIIADGVRPTLEQKLSEAH